MTSQTLTNPTASIIRNRKIIGILGWVCLFLAITTPLIVYLIENTSFPLIFNYLSEIRMTPAWPQIGFLSTPTY
jgi:hypothetical protein